MMEMEIEVMQGRQSLRLPSGVAGKTRTVLMFSSVFSSILDDCLWTLVRVAKSTGEVGLEQMMSCRQHYHRYTKRAALGLDRKERERGLC